MPEFAFSEKLIQRLRTASSVAVLTGAGISAESGIPTFRDPDGLWASLRPEELASMEGFLSNPARVQQWYAHRRQIVHGTQPNAGHRALVDLENRYAGFTLITQNVDNLHREAGSRKVLELHGSLLRSYCIACERQVTEELLIPAEDGLMHCPTCNGMIRPDVVWFGECLPPDVLDAAFEAAEHADVFLSIGTSGLVYPAAGLPEVASKAGAYVVEINLEPSGQAIFMDELLLGKAGEVLPALVAALDEP